MHGILLSDDLIFTSRIQATARANGLKVAAARTIEQFRSLASVSRPEGVILDLHHAQLELPALLSEMQAVWGALPRIVGYGSHVDAERLRMARKAGCDLVMPRSQFVEQLESRITEWLSTRIENADETTGLSPRPQEST